MPWLSYVPAATRCRKADVARLSAYQRRHINIHGHYTVALPDLGGTHCVLRDPKTPGRRRGCVGVFGRLWAKSKARSRAGK